MLFPDHWFCRCVSNCVSSDLNRKLWMRWSLLWAVLKSNAQRCSIHVKIVVPRRVFRFLYVSARFSLISRIKRSSRARTFLPRSGSIPTTSSTRTRWSRKWSKSATSARPVCIPASTTLPLFVRTNIMRNNQPLNTFLSFYYFSFLYFVNFFLLLVPFLCVSTLLTPIQIAIGIAIATDRPPPRFPASPDSPDSPSLLSASPALSAASK